MTTDEDLDSSEFRAKCYLCKEDVTFEKASSVIVKEKDWTDGKGRRRTTTLSKWLCQGCAKKIGSGK